MKWLGVGVGMEDILLVISVARVLCLSVSSSEVSERIGLAQGSF